MAVYNKRPKAYAMGTPLAKLTPEPIISSRAPSTRDRAEVGTLWINKSSTAQETYVNGGIFIGNSQWNPLYQLSTTSSVASPTAAVTSSVIKGAVTFTGFTTASAASQEFTFTNTLIAAGDAIMVTACTQGANDAQMTVTRVITAAGSFVVTLTNNGAASVNGDCVITFDLMK